MAIKFVNNFQTTLASAISAAATSITIAAGDGARLGTLGSDVYYLTIYADTNATIKEIVKVTARSTDTLTVVRAQDGTTAQAWSAGSWMEARLPKVVLESFAQGSAGVLDITGGGTGATTAATARTNLGLGTIATQAASAVTITGGTVTGITDLAVADGGTGASTHTANAVLIGNGTSPITSVAPGTSGNVLTSNGTTWASTAPTAVSAATQADQETGTSTTTFVSPGRQQYHPSAPKAWLRMTCSGGTPSIVSSYNVTSLTDNGAGDFTANFTVAFSNTNYMMIGNSFLTMPNTNDARAVCPHTFSTGSCRFTTNSGATPEDNNVYTSIVWYGDQ